jgi:TonB family protein
MFTTPVRRDRRRSTTAFLLTLGFNGALVAALFSLHDAPAVAAGPADAVLTYREISVPVLLPEGGSAPAPKQLVKKTPVVPMPDASVRPVDPQPDVAPVSPVVPDAPLSTSLAPDGSGTGPGNGTGPGDDPGTGTGPGGGTGPSGPSVLDVDYDVVKVRSQVNPVFPESARQQGIGAANCTVKLEIDVRGKPTSAVASGCPDVFAQAAQTAALKWRFVPLRAGGHDVPGRFNITFRFRYE